MPVNIRDNRIVTPVVRADARNISGRTDLLVMNVVGTFFTESLDLGSFLEMLGLLQTFTVSGNSPTLDVNLQYSYDQKNWVDSGDAFAQITQADYKVKAFTRPWGKYVRLKLVVGGTTPSFTVTLKLSMKS